MMRGHLLSIFELKSLFQGSSHEGTVSAPRRIQVSISQEAESWYSFQITPIDSLSILYFYSQGFKTFGMQSKHDHAPAAGGEAESSMMTHSPQKICSGSLVLYYIAG